MNLGGKLDRKLFREARSARMKIPGGGRGYDKARDREFERVTVSGFETEMSPDN